jgi:hypothetical protein
MGEIGSNVPVKAIDLEAVVTRADGTVEDLGVIASTHPDHVKKPSLKDKLLRKTQSR